MKTWFIIGLTVLLLACTSLSGNPWQKGTVDLCKITLRQEYGRHTPYFVAGPIIEKTPYLGHAVWETTLHDQENNSYLCEVTWYTTAPNTSSPDNYSVLVLPMD